MWQPIFITTLFIPNNTLATNSFFIPSITNSNVNIIQVNITMDCLFPIILSISFIIVF